MAEVPIDADYDTKEKVIAALTNLQFTHPSGRLLDAESESAPNQDEL